MDNTSQYSEKILNYFDNPKYVGCIKESYNVFIGYVQGIDSNGFIKFYVKICHDKIIDIKYNVRACPTTVALCEFVAGLVMNKDMSILDTINYQQIADNFKLPQNKLHCAILVEEVISRIKANITT